MAGLHYGSNKKVEIEVTWACDKYGRSNWKSECMIKEQRY